MQSQEPAQPLEEQESDSNNFERDPQFWATKIFDILMNHMMDIGVSPFIISEEQSLQQIEGSQGSDGNKQSFNFSYCRKEKSLEELTKKFIDKFQGAQDSILILDVVTQELNVQRRRIYDVINTMESLNVVCKIKKNFYKWKGLKEAVKTIQQYSKEEHKIQKPSFGRDKRENSLQILASQFLKFFSRNKSIITLDDASKELLGLSPNESKKTKVRRLYDIVNVFKCVGLVKKMKLQGSKPGYQWMGTKILKQIINSRGKFHRERKNTYEDQEEEQTPKTQNDTRFHDEANKKIHVGEFLLNKQLSQKDQNSSNSRQNLIQKPRKITQSKISTSQSSKNQFSMPRKNQKKCITVNRIQRSKSFEQNQKQQAKQSSNDQKKMSKKLGNYDNKLVGSKSESFLNSIFRKYRNLGFNTNQQIIDKIEQNIWNNLQQPPKVIRNSKNKTNVGT